MSFKFKFKGLSMLLILFCFLILANSVNAALNDANTYYSFDTGNFSGNDVYDLSGNLNNGTNNGATLGSVVGILNFTADFQTSDYVATQTAGNLVDYTVSTWVYLDDAPGDDDVIFGSNNGANDRTRIRVKSDGNLNLLELRNGVTINELFSFTDCYATWCQVVVTSEQNGLAIVYVNGTAVINVSTSNNDISLGAVDIWIGALNQAGSPQDYWDGRIDEFSVYNRSWSSTEVLESYNSGVGFNPYDVTPPFVASVTINLETPVNNLTTNNVTNNFTFNVTGNINITQCSLLVNGIINKTSNSTICYQETANVSTACGGLNTGTYGKPSAFNFWKDSMDGLWNTFDEQSFWVNYTVPSDTLNATWLVKDTVGTRNITIPSSCLAQVPLQLQLETFLGGGDGVDYNCYNGVTWTTLLSQVTGDNRIYEEAINWNLSQFVSTNFTTSIEQTLPEDNYNWSITCQDINGTNWNATNTNNLTIDTSAPTIITNFLNLSSFLNFLTGQFNFSDNNLIHSVNFSVDGTQFFGNGSINQPTFNYTMNHNITNLSVGSHTLTVRVADAHTANKLKEAKSYNPSNCLFNDCAKYSLEAPYQDMELKMKRKGSSIFDSWYITEHKDRFSETYIPQNPSSTQTFIIESDKYIDIVTDKKGSYGGTWLIIGNHWKDFVLKDEPNTEVSIVRITDYEVEVTIKNIQNPTLLEFQSTGDLNILIQNYTFFTVNATETFSAVIYEDQLTTYVLELFGNFNVITPNVTLNLNSTAILVTADLISNASYQLYSYNYLVNEGVVNVTTDWNHNWTIVLNTTSTTTTQSQTIYNVRFGLCDSSNFHPVLNLSYFDEISSAAITANNSYLLNATDGIKTYGLNGQFQNATNNKYCTNVDPADITFNFDVSGTFTLSKDGYVTRVIDFSPVLPIAASNDPVTQQSLFLIETNASTTVNINWLSTDYQIIDGTMMVYRCNADATFSLVESSPIIAGNSYANIQLLLQPYKYEVIYKGNLFINTDSYSKCHVEYADSVRYYIDINPTNTAEFVGLIGIPCTLEEVSNHTIKMTWEANPQNDEYVQGCIKGYRHSIHGLVEVYNNCSSEIDGYSRLVSVPVQNQYTVVGSVKQGNNEIACGNELIIDYSTAPGGAFGTDALFAVIVLVLSLALIYAGDGEMMLFGAGIGIIASWILGIFMVGSVSVVTSVMIFLVLIAVIGRYTRK